MCGIAGILGSDDMKRTAWMIAAMGHRGPDDSGLWSDPKFKVALGNCRLAIQDTTAAAHMPMESAGRQCWITYNGEIYNFRELRADLKGLGHVFRTASDTEVVLAAYLHWGTSCLERLRGMFAFAIFNGRPDTEGGRLFLARDRFGIKPLYWARLKQALVFASELNGMLASGLVASCLNHQALWDYLSLGSVPFPRTLLEDVQVLLPGHALIANKDDVHIWKYWDLADAVAKVHVPLNLEDSTVELRSRMEEVIRLHMIADVPVGAFLSGGIDSSTIVGLMNQYSDLPLRTYSIGFQRTDREQDELPFAKLVSEHFGTRHEEIVITGNEVAESFDEFVGSLDQPSVDGLNTFLVSKAARKGVTVALSGLGADELFAGYPHFYQFERANRWLPNGNRFVNSGLNAMRGILPGRFAQPAQFMTASPLGRHCSIRCVFQEREKRRLANGRLREACPGRNIGEFYSNILSTDEAVRLDNVAGTSYVETRGYLAHTLLRDADAVSMSQSLELRVPFLDHKLAEFVFALPPSYKMHMHDGKIVLREAMRDLPPGIVLTRRKACFDLPMSNWMAGPLSKAVTETLQAPEAYSLFNRKALGSLQKAVGAESWYQPWSIAVLIRWMAHRGIHF